jgi:hypothetical protein
VKKGFMKQAAVLQFIFVATLLLSFGNSYHQKFELSLLVSNISCSEGSGVTESNREKQRATEKSSLSLWVFSAVLWGQNIFH